MVQFKHEGFLITTNADEATQIKRLAEIGRDTIEQVIERDNYMMINDIVERIIISGESVASFYNDIRMGFKNKSLEPYKIRATKNEIVVDYTGTQGGDPYQLRIAL